MNVANGKPGRARNLNFGCCSFKISIDYRGTTQPFDENDIAAEVDCNSNHLVEQPERILKDVMDQLSNAFGYLESDCFDEEGHVSQR